jgi:hypothetical protein
MQVQIEDRKKEENNNEIQAAPKQPNIVIAC